MKQCQCSLVQSSGSEYGVVRYRAHLVQRDVWQTGCECTGLSFLLDEWVGHVIAIER